MTDKLFMIEILFNLVVLSALIAIGLLFHLNNESQKKEEKYDR